MAVCRAHLPREKVILKAHDTYYFGRPQIDEVHYPLSLRERVLAGVRVLPAILRSCALVPICHQCCSWLTTYSGLAIMLAVLAFNLMGDALRHLLDPRLRRE